MSMKRDNNETRAIGAELSIGRNYARDFYAQNVILITVEGHYRPDRLERTPNMTSIFLASDSSDTLAFSNIGTALEFVRDSHADLNPEGSALMLETRAGLVPASNKAVKASRDRVMRFSAAGADAASVVAGIQSKLDGALSACALVGIDPANVATVGNLRAALLDAQSLVDTDAATAVLTIEVMPLHKRGYKN
jgi:hypothetical protein